MIAAMPRPRPPHLHREETRHGRVVWYVRVGKGPRIRLKLEPGAQGFDDAYQAALRGETLPDQNKFPSRTLGWLIARYRDSAAWTKLSMATRRQRENIFQHVLKSAGREQLSRITKASIMSGQDRRRKTPNAARHFVQTMRGLFIWAVGAEHVLSDPTAGVKTPRPPTDGHEPWPIDWCEAYEKRWPTGTRERVAYDVLLYTGLRRGDAVRLGRPHVKKGVGSIRTEKTGEMVFVPILPPLQASLDAGPLGELTYIASEAGKPMSKEGFGNWFREACRKASVPGSAHGLRKTRATIAAENGASESELDALFGWRGGKMASLYTKTASRERLSLSAAGKMLSEREANAYSRTLPSGAGRSRKPKAKSNG